MSCPAKLDGYVPLNDWARANGYTKSQANVLISLCKLEYRRLGQWIMVPENARVKEKK